MRASLHTFRYVSTAGAIALVLSGISLFSDPIESHDSESIQRLCVEVGILVCPSSGLLDTRRPRAASLGFALRGKQQSLDQYVRLGRIACRVRNHRVLH